jgi:serine/threonine protein kinase
LIGKGAHSQVYQVRDKSNAVMYALKAVSLKEPHNAIDQLINEKNILCNICHPFIVGMHYAFQSFSHIFLVLDYCAGGELFYYINHFGAMDEQMAKFLLCEIILAVEYLHSKCIVYRDIKVLHSAA